MFIVIFSSLEKMVTSEVLDGVFILVLVNK